MRGQKKDKVPAMKICGQVGSQRVLGHDDKEITRGPLYNRTLSMKVLEVSPPPHELVTMFRKEKAQEGNLSFSLYEDKGCIQTTKEFGSLFNATLLEKVRLNDDTSPAKDEFYPVLRRLLTERRNWASSFISHGLSSFVVFLMEWTASVLEHYRHPLKEAGVYGLAGVAQFPYYYQKDVWKAFCEHWSPLTNTLHHGGGEVGISLMDLKRIGGLPILGEPYEEYLPPNEELLDNTKYPSTVLELLRIHTELCQHGNGTEVSWYKWIRYFYRGKQRFYAYGEDPLSSHKRKTPPPKPKEDLKQLPPLHVSHEGELAAFLALLLSRFVLPTGPRSVRPETFVMACLMAQGKKISLAPTVLGHIYHELGRVATHPGNPGNAEPNFGLHFVVGWLAEYFPNLYPCRPDEEFEESFPYLARYAGLLGKPLDLYQARLTFRGIEYVSYRAVSFGSGIGSQDHKDVDTGGLSEQCFEYLMTIRSAVLPVRLGATLLLEPYYPNRFARQFGFDQDIPANKLSFSVTKRRKRSLEDIALAYARLFRKGTGTLFHIPPEYHQGTYTHNYCRWWIRISAPYLTQSCRQIRTILTGNKKCLEREPIYVIAESRLVTSGMRGAVETPEWHSQSHKSSSSAGSSAHVHASESSGKRRTDRIDNSLGEDSVNSDINFKRLRYSMPAETDLPYPTETVPTFPIFDHLPDADDRLSGEDSPPTPIGGDIGDAVTERSPQVQPSSDGIDSLAIAVCPATPNGLQTLLPVTMNAWFRSSLISGISHIVTVLSTLNSPQELLAERSSSLLVLEGLQGLAKIANIDLTWFTLKVRDLFDSVGVVTDITSKVDIQHVEHLSSKLAESSSELESKQARLAHLETQWSLNLSKEENELLILKEQVREKELQLESTRANHAADSLALQDSICQEKNKIQLLQSELDQAGQGKLAELKSKEMDIKAFAQDIIAFSSSR